ncbi:hypothetical protein KP77_21140 [Jeotgalibacillus alimentarius]|uniref:DUF5590 domain-containing protein n=1 Tax=Jeotgalibacillus alimentarius TaxID=135826 RepID=A0A0C2VY62_9BACL|nr:hypothetical protein [Jeotgalibacillus alimentarius]KIL48903.1 hypothetical protein KP77_21140 [Jeotgalibacillus alimentarius]
MKKWILLMIAIITVFIACILIIFNAAKNQVNNQLDIAEAAAMDEGISVEKSYHYYGSAPYSVVEGTSDGVEKLFFLPENGEEPVIIDAADGVDQEQVLNMLEADDNPQKILSSKIGMEPVGAVWEVIYEDEDELLNYYYVKFESGEWWRTIRNL